MTKNIIEFSVSNYRSFKDINTLSMVAANITSQDKNIDSSNVFETSKKEKLLSSAVIYGANASGKSNLINAMLFLRQFVLKSSNENRPGEGISYSNFKLSTETEKAPSFFQLIFFLNDLRYRYGIEIDHDQVLSEWLYSETSQKESYLFIRDIEKIKISRLFPEGRGLEKRTRPNVSFLSIAAEFNGEISNQVFKWFKDFNIISGLDDRSYKGYTIKNYISGKYQKEILELLKRLDLGINDLQTKKLADSEFSYSIPDNIPTELRSKILDDIELERTIIQTIHKKYGENGEVVGDVFFDLRTNESHGTEKLFYLTAPLIDTLMNGKILVIDEIEARLHPMITRSIIQLFNDKTSNPHNAQLIISTHDTNLLTKKIFRRDQIWFVEKDQKGASHLYSLAELKVRNFDSYESDYIKGRYGAIPFLSDIKMIECER